MKIDLVELNQLHAEKLLEKQVHPELPLTIWNYAQTCQYSGEWTDTLLMCRGLVTDNEGTVISRPFKKFFNLEERRHVHSPNFTIWNKEDGSLGIVFKYNDVWHVSSRGSFTSDQAVKAKEMLDKVEGKDEVFKEGLTYLFEIIYPENKICIDYGSDEKLVLLGAVDIESGEEFNPSQISQSCFEIPDQHHFSDYAQIAELDWENKEGFVVHFDNGHKCKIKFANYLVKHKIVWSLTNKMCHEYLASGKIEELIQQVPDEFYEIVKSEIEEIEEDFMFLKLMCEGVFKQIYCENRKNFALSAKMYKYPQILFAMLDKKNVDGVIWKTLEPKYSIRLLTK